MNKDQVQGRVEEAKGSVKQTTGRVTGKPDLETVGRSRRPRARCKRPSGT